MLFTVYRIALKGPYYNPIEMLRNKTDPPSKSFVIAALPEKNSTPLKIPCRCRQGCTSSRTIISSISKGTPAWLGVQQSLDLSAKVYCTRATGTD
jgi:hypothetical protein